MLDLDTFFVGSGFREASRGFAMDALDWGFRSRGVRGGSDLVSCSTLIVRDEWVIMMGYGGGLFRILQIYVSLL